MYLWEMDKIKDGAKISHPEWVKNKYIYWSVSREEFINEIGSYCDIIKYHYNNSYWEYYKEPKQLNRYWRWKMNIWGVWRKCEKYLDVNGRDTKGDVPFSNWHDIQKIICENDYVDVEE